MRGTSQQFADWIVQPTLDRLSLNKADPETTVDVLLSIAATESAGLSALAAPPQGRERTVPSFGPYRFRDVIIPLVHTSVDAALADRPSLDPDVATSLDQFNADYRLPDTPPDASVFVTWLDCATAYARIILWHDGSDYAPAVGDLREQYELYLALWNLPKRPAFSLWVANRAEWDGNAPLLARLGERVYLDHHRAAAEARGAEAAPRRQHHYCGVEVPLG